MWVGRDCGCWDVVDASGAARAQVGRYQGERVAYGDVGGWAGSFVGGVRAGWGGAEACQRRADVRWDEPGWLDTGGRWRGGSC